MIPFWLHILSIACLTLAAVCFVVILLDVAAGHQQQMWIMNVVWPVSALYAGPLAVVAYYRLGRLTAAKRVRAAHQRGDPPPGKHKPFWQSTAVGASHCGAGCTLGDICAEWLAFGAPVVAVWFGWRTVFPDKIYAVWILDYLFALVIGIAFQYFSIVPMRNLSPGRGLITAIKADTLSLTSWQVGMYGFMAAAHFGIFEHILQHRLETNMPEFWFMMQLAMLCGFITAYPVNWWLLRRGIKEKM